MFFSAKNCISSSLCSTYMFLDAFDHKSKFIPLYEFALFGIFRAVTTNLFTQCELFHGTRLSLGDCFFEILCVHKKSNYAKS